MKFRLFIFLSLTLYLLLPFALFLYAQGDSGNFYLPSPQRADSAFSENFENHSIENPSNDALSTPHSSMTSRPINPRIADILDFWFGSLSDPAYFPESKVPIWFSATKEVDRQIREYFTEDVLAALNGEYNDWRRSPKGRLALILLLDQFTRHIYRNKTQEFIGDPMARGLVLEGLQQGDDQYLYPIERAFFYLPLEHSENLDLQNLSVALYRKLVSDSPMSIKPKIDPFLQYAILQRKQIANFGRFPHRNWILNRKTTPEEIIFLKQWGRSHAINK